MEFTAFYSELIPEGELTSFTVFDAYRYFAGEAMLMTHNVDQAQNIYYQRIISSCLTDTLI